MNKITLRKGILKNIQASHSINGVDYDKANLLVKRKDGKEDLINIRFKKFSNTYKENDEVDLVGNVRSYSQQLENGKNSVSLYVFTYFDRPEETVEDETTISNNIFEVDGRICKIDTVRTLNNGKHNIHFILANNIITSNSNQKLNSYLPCIAWGKNAKELSKLEIGTKISIVGELHSREYKKILENGEVEVRLAREISVNSFEIISQDNSTENG